MNAILHTITPIHISGSENSVFSPYANYVIDKKGDKRYIVFIDEDRLVEYFSKNKREMDNFIGKFLLGFKNNRSEYDLGEFIREKHLNLKNFEKYRELLRGEDTGKKEIKGFIHNPRGRYIPGSSIKGAIRTALLYSYIKEKDIIKEKILSKIKNAKRLNTKTVFNNVLKDGRDDSFLRVLNSYFRNIQVGDSLPIPISQFFIGDINTLHLKRTNRRFNVLRLEFFTSGKDVDFTLRLKDYVRGPHDFWSFLWEKDYTTLFKYVNTFALDFINYEIKILEKNQNKEQATTIEDMVNSYKNLKDLIEKSKNKRAFFPIGTGTTFFSKTIDMIFSEKEMEAIRDKFKDTSRNGKVISMGIKKGGKSNPFPITRYTLPFIKSHLMGWVSIRLKEE